MGTGLFSTRAITPQGIGARAHQRKQRRFTLDAFAEQLAEHGDIQLAATEIGVSPSYGRVLFGTLRRDLGWQAC